MAGLTTAAVHATGPDGAAGLARVVGNLRALVGGFEESAGRAPTADEAESIMTADSDGVVDIGAVPDGCVFAAIGVELGV